MWCRVDWSDTVIVTVTRLMKIVPHVGIYEYEMYDGFQDEAFLLHSETRRKCRTTFVGLLLLLNSTRLPVSCKTSIRTF